MRLCPRHGVLLYHEVEGAEAQDLEAISYSPTEYHFSYICYIIPTYFEENLFCRRHANINMYIIELCLQRSMCNVYVHVYLFVKLSFRYRGKGKIKLQY